MALTLKTPGVFIEEISVFPPSVAPVATAIPAFIGYTDKGPKTPTRITSLPEFESIFGGAKPEDFSITLTDTVDPLNTSTVLTRKISVTLPSPSPYKLYYSLQMYFANGGGPCYIVSVGTGSFPAIALSDFQAGLALIAKEDEPTLLLFPDAVGLSLNAGVPTAYGTLVQDTLSQCNKLKDRFGVFDLQENDITQVNDFRTAIGNNNLKYGAAYFPFLNTVLNFAVDETATQIDTHNLGGGTQTSLAGTSLATLKTSNPSLYASIYAEINKLFVTIPPSGTMVGIYASVDRDRGVWKAPANVSINSVSGPTILVTASQQEDLNVDPTSGKSINVIRSFTGKGTLVWGARTLAGNDNEWRYVPVRRLFIFAEESIQKATEFVVFEPNDRNTWTRVKTLISNFLTNLWRDGALAGATPKEAFFVNVGLGETMTAQDILEGKLIIQVGLAAVRPAEFIVLQFMHKLQES